jgi:hypothetical protein
LKPKTREGTMPFDVEITFGGLCLFVQRDDSAKTGLFVLMPAFVNHLPFLYYDPKYAKESGTEQIIYPIHQVIDLTGHPSGKARQKLPPEIAPVSEILSDKRIANHWTEDKLLLAPLTARIDLDLGWPVVPHPTAMKVDVHGFYKKKGDTLPGTHPHTVTGTAIVTITGVADGQTINVGGKILYQQRDGIKFSLLNMNPNELHSSTTTTYPKGKTVPHFAAYYNLVKDCSWNCGGPSLKLTKQVSVGPYHAEFVDPVTCMLGGGCSEQETC